jgi:hypothetical protein
MIYEFEQNDMFSLYRQRPKTTYFQWIRMNVNALKLIQLGISISDEEGKMPEGVNTW